MVNLEVLEIINQMRIILIETVQDWSVEMKIKIIKDLKEHLKAVIFNTLKA